MPYIGELTKEAMEVTPREFVRTAALLTATAVVGRAAGLPGIEEHAEVLSKKQKPLRAVAMGSTFPYGAVYFRKSNPPPEDWARL